MNYLILSILLKVIDVYTYLLIAYALLSWFPGAYNTTIGRFIIGVVEPVIAPFRKLKLQFFGLDFTIWIVVIAFNILARFLVYLLI